MQSLLAWFTASFFWAVLVGSTLFSNGGMAQTDQPAQTTLTPTPASTTSVSGLKGKLAFVLEANNKAEIYVMNADGTNLHAITRDGVVNWYPTFSPDGTKIAFTTTRDGEELLYIMNADGSDQKRVGKGGGSGLSWSPDGKQIVFGDIRDNNFNLYVINVDGTNERQLTTDPAYEAHPNWSPDGKHILFISDYGRPKKEGINFHLYIMDADGSNQRDLMPNDWTTSMGTAWSPDGQTIGFYVIDKDPQKAGFYTMNVDGSNRKRIHNVPDMDAVWSPDGQYLAAWNLATKDGRFANNLVIMRPDGSERVVLTNFNKGYRLLSWGK